MTWHILTNEAAPVPQGSSILPLPYLERGSALPCVVCLAFSSIRVQFMRTSARNHGHRSPAYDGMTVRSASGAQVVTGSLRFRDAMRKTTCTMTSNARERDPQDLKPLNTSQDMSIRMLTFLQKKVLNKCSSLIHSC